MKNLDLYRLFFEEASDALLALSLDDCTLLAVNSAFVALTGFSREEIEGESLSLLNTHAPEGRERVLELELFKNPGFYNDIALSARDHSVRYVSLKVRHIQIAGKAIALAVISDDTPRQILMRDLATKHQSLELAYQDLGLTHKELKATQGKMIQASKLVALGELAAGMSHELNQPLTGVRGFAQEISDLIDEPKVSKSEIRKLSLEIIKNVDKMAALLAHLRNFARQEKAQHREENLKVSLTEVIANATKLLERQFKNHDIELAVESSGDLQVLGQAHPFEQVLINLLTNARDAVRDRLKVQPKPRGKITVSTRAENSYVEIRVQDNGQGIAENIQRQIFDPFFSTKEPGQGMGLGLSISFGIAHRFGGELTLVESSPETGTTFLLRLPRAESRKRAA